MSEAGHPVDEAAAAPGPSVRAEHSSTFLRLGQLWQRSGHYSLLLAAVDDSSYRDQLIARLLALGPAQRIDLAPPDTPQDWLARLQQAHADGAVRAQVCLPISPRRPDAWWQQANVLRERLADALPAAQLVWLADADVDAAAHQAPDLWNWREAVFSFSTVLPSAGLPTVAGQTFRSHPSQDAEAIAQRLAHIEGALASQSADESSAAHLWLEAAQIRQRLGNWPAAQAAARQAASSFQQAGNAANEAQARALLAELQWRSGDPEGALQVLRAEVLPNIERLGDVRAKAVTMGLIADILQACGRADEALRIRLVDQLPVFEHLGDLRARAVTMGQIADILQARGQADEALRIHQDEQLPVFERLGDVREKAVTMGKIADIMQARGQTDEALRIYQDEVLPVFDHLGEVREKAVAIGKIADILHARGQFDEALRIRQDEQLPAFVRMGDVQAEAVTLFKVANLRAAQGLLGHALRLLTEDVLPMFDRLGLAREAEITRQRIAVLRRKEGGRWSGGG